MKQGQWNKALPWCDVRSVTVRHSIATLSSGGDHSSHCRRSFSFKIQERFYFFALVTMLWKMTNLDEDHAIHFDINIATGFILEASSYDDTRRSSQNPARKDTFTEIVSAFWPQAILEQTTRYVTHRQMLHTDRCYTRLPITEFQSIKTLQKNWGQFDSSECHVKVVLTDCSSCCCDQQESPHLTCVMCSRWTNWHLPAVNLLFLPHLCHVCKVLLSFIGLCVFSGSSDWSTVDMQSHAAGGWVRRSLTHSHTHEH